MAQDYFQKSLKKLLLAGIGAAAITTEKSKELLDKLAEKGELTVEHGKAMNEELKHCKRSKDVDDFLENMTPEQMEELKAKILRKESAEEESKTSVNEEPDDQPEAEAEGL